MASILIKLLSRLSVISVSFPPAKMKQRKRGGDGEIMIDRDVDETFRPNENEGEIMIDRGSAQSLL